MTETEIEIDAALGAIKLVIKAMLFAQARQNASSDKEHIRAYLDGLRDTILTSWSAGKLDENQLDVQAVLQRVPFHIQSMFPT